MSKKSTKIKQLNKKNILSVSHRLFTNYPIPLKSKKVWKTYLDEEKKEVRKQVYESKFIKTIGNYHIELISNEEYGYPYGTDNLILLYLNYKVREVKNKKFTVTITDFIRYFEFNECSKNYKMYAKAFKRIFYTTFYFTKFDKKTQKEIGKTSFRVIKAWKGNMGDEKGLNKNEMILTDDYYNLIQKEMTPFDVNVLKQIKKAPIKSNFYIFLVYRLFLALKFNKGEEIFIPFFGTSGLAKQMGTNYSTKRNTRKVLIDVIKKIQDIWEVHTPPFYLKKYKRTTPRYKGGLNQTYEDGLYICIDNENELHINPNKGKDLRLKKEQYKNKMSVKHPCPHCGGKLEKRFGKQTTNGTTLPAFIKCLDCQTNFSNNKYPQLWDNTITITTNNTNENFKEKNPLEMYGKMIDIVLTDENIGIDEKLKLINEFKEMYLKK